MSSLAPAIIYAAAALFSSRGVEYAFPTPPDEHLVVSAACGPSPDGDCDVYYWYTAIASADFERGLPEFEAHFPNRRVCCGLWCIGFHPLASGAPLMLEEDELVLECQAAAEGPPPLVGGRGAAWGQQGVKDQRWDTGLIDECRLAAEEI